MLKEQTLSQAFSELFSGMSASIFILITLGLMFLIIEFYHSSRKIMGALGAVLITAGIILRALSGASATVIFLLMTVVSLILFTAHVIILFMQKHEWLVRSYNIISQRGQSGGEGRLGYLKNMTGIAITDIDESGSITINDINFTVTAKQRIEQGSFVRVIKTDGDNIVVELFDPEIILGD